MSQAHNMYAVSHDQVVSFILATGMEKANNDGKPEHIWTHIEGPKGIGKTTLGKMLSESLPDHTFKYVDCTALEAGDLGIPKFKEADEQDFVRFVANEVLGLHDNKPLIIQLDELSKAARGVMLPLLRLGLEREMFGYRLHPDSIVISNGNLMVEALGDEFQPHQLDRFCLMELRNPTNIEWLENYAIPNNLNYQVMAWVKDNGQVFEDWRSVKDPEDNQYIDHPQAVGRRKGTTPRAVAKAAFIVDNRTNVDDHTLTASLIGTIGPRAALDFMAFLKISDQLPTLEDIKANPAQAIVPSNASAVCMVVYRTLAQIDRSWVDSWMDYMARLSPEAQALFVNGVRAPRYSEEKRTQVMTNAKFSAWAAQNNYMFGSDTK